MVEEYKRRVSDFTFVPHAPSSLEPHPDSAAAPPASHTVVSVEREEANQGLILCDSSSSSPIGGYPRAPRDILFSACTDTEHLYFWLMFLLKIIVVIFRNKFCLFLLPPSHAPDKTRGAAGDE